MIYCTRCLYPNTKPDLTFNEEGICSACIAFDQREQIDWKEREVLFKKLVVKADTDHPYDCVIPVSGGKDSHYQVIKALEYGLRPLAVTAFTDDISDIGFRNLNNISKLGVDHVTVSVNQSIRRKINRYTLETIGDISWAEHVTIFTIPIREAMLRNIPMVLWGENPQNEYGAPNLESMHTYTMEKTWLPEFGGLNGLRVQDIIDAEIASKKDMHQYMFPHGFEGKLPENFPYSVFLGQFFPWDGASNAELAMKYGFEVSDYRIECSGYNYENLDNYQTGIHDRFKYLKFGFGRATDLVCNHIRRGRITREEGIEHINLFDGIFPDHYLGKPLEEILEPLEMTIEDYIIIENKFANTDLFKFDGYPNIPVPIFKAGENA